MSAAPSEIALIGYLVQNPDEFPAVRPLLKEYKFQSTISNYLYACIDRCWTTYETVPNKVQFVDFIQADRRKPEEQRNTLASVVEKVYGLQLSGLDRMGVMTRVLECNITELQESLGQISAHSIAEDTVSIVHKLEALQQLMVDDKGKCGFILDDSFTLDPVKTLGTYLGNPVPLGLPRADGLLGGGMRNGELLLPAALPSDGKSMLLTTIVCNWIRRGLRVYVCQLDNTFEEFTAKCWSNLTGIPLQDLLNESGMSSETASKLALFKQRHPHVSKNLIVRKWPRGSKTIKDVERDMQMFQRMCRSYDLKRGVAKDIAGKIDGWGGDYLDVFAGEAQVTKGSERFRFDDICKHAAGLCERWEIPGILPTQLHRTAKFLERPDIDNLAEAFSKSWHAAIIPLLFGSKSERYQGQMNFFWAKTRRVNEQFVTPMIRDKQHQTFRDDPSREVYWIDGGSNNTQAPAYQSNKPEKKRELTKHEVIMDEETGEIITKPKKVKGAA